MVCSLIGGDGVDGGGGAGRGAESKTVGLVDLVALWRGDTLGSGSRDTART